MARFIARGRLVLDGVDFLIDADSIEEAREKAKSGDYTEYDVSGASAWDWTLDTDVESDE